MPILSPPVILLSSLLNFMPIVLRNSSHYFRQHIFHPHDASVLMPPRCGRLCASTNSRTDRSRAAHGRARQRAVLRRARLRDRGHLGRPPQPGRLHRFLRHGPVRKAGRASEMAGLARTLWGQGRAGPDPYGPGQLGTRRAIQAQRQRARPQPLGGVPTLGGPGAGSGGSGSWPTWRRSSWAASSAPSSSASACPRPSSRTPSPPRGAPPLHHRTAP